MASLTAGVCSGRSIGSSMLGAVSAMAMNSPAGGCARTASARLSMPRRMSMMRRFSSKAWSSRKRRSCCDSWATVRWVCSPASSQS